MKFPLIVISVGLLLGALESSVFGGEDADPFFIPRPEFYRAQVPDREKPNLFVQVGRDFKHVFTSKENLAIAAVGLGSAWGASHLDERIRSSRFNSQRFEDTAFDQAYEPAAVLGGAGVQVGGAFLTYGLGKLFSNEGVSDLGRDLVRAQIVTQTLTQAVKAAVGRERPDGSNRRSFPSGHASGSFATATVLQRRYGYKVGVPAFIFAGYIASSRLSEDRHFLSDVVFGAAVGVLVGRTVTVDLAGAKFVLAPTLARQGAGVQLTWLGDP